MNKKEWIFVQGFILLFAIVLFSIVTYFFYEEIKDTEIGIRKYKTAIEEIESKNKQIKNISYSEQPVKTTMTSSEIANQFLVKLYNCNIKPTRYQIKDNDAVSFSFTSSISDFIKSTNYIGEKKLNYKMKTCSIKPEKGVVSVNICIVPDNVSILEDDENSVSEDKLFSFLKSKVVVIKNDQKEKVNKTEKEEVINVSDEYQVIGFIMDNGNINYLYLKTKSTGRIYKIAQNDVLQDTEEYYILLLKGSKIKILKHK